MNENQGGSNQGDSWGGPPLQETQGPGGPDYPPAQGYPSAPQYPTGHPVQGYPPVPGYPAAPVPGQGWAPSPYGAPVQAKSSSNVLKVAIVAIVVAAIAGVGAYLVLNHPQNNGGNNVSWINYNAPDGSFSVSLPVSPTITDIPASTSNGVTVSGKSFNSRSSSSLVYTITYDDYAPPGALNTVGPTVALDNMQAAMAAKGSVDSSRDTTASSYPAREVRGTVSGVYVRALFVVVNDRVYVVEADAKSSSALDSSDVNRYFNSLVIH